MNKVVTINLNGRAYQLEESGYEALRAYLDDASARLADDPGKAEIIADLEQAIAEKCDKVLAPHKSVVLTDEVKRIIDEMGPVEGDAKKESASEESASTHGRRAPRRFFLIREDAVCAGVCAGLAAYFNIDVTIVRILFIALTVFTGGAWILLYIALAILVPYADTAEARAQAHGEAFNAEALVQRAKERWGESYERVTGNKFDWDKIQNKHDRHAWKREMRRKWREERRAKYPHRSPILGLLKGALAIVWILALISLVTTGAIFGWVIPAGIPIWVALIALFVVYHAVTGPLKGAQYSHARGNEYGYSEWDGLVDGLTVLFLVIAFVWAYTQIPQVYAFVHHPIAGTEQFINWLKTL
ncbi:MAG TPA: PspC domain-containing protein [Candidatus Paceibacterota bacterium]|jgi:phage shock protein PspC (stress-responsive transcriptional regulator)|nr:PspC domain-containing protein [Candidatus Paceibacterota bacterium]